MRNRWSLIIFAICAGSIVMFAFLSSCSSCFDKNRYRFCSIHNDLHSSSKDHHSIKEDTNQSAIGTRFIYPPRSKMSNCEPLFGKVTVFVAVVTLSYATWVSYFYYNHYFHITLCKLRKKNYTYILTFYVKLSFTFMPILKGKWHI